MSLIALLLLGFSWTRSTAHQCIEFNVRITGDGLSHFVTEQYAREHILDLGDPIIGTRMADLDVSRMENEIASNPFVKEVVAYRTVDQKMEVVITQRKPILRLIDAQGNNAYLDEDGRIMETSDEYTERCIPLTGSFVLAEVQTKLFKDSLYDGLLDMALFIAQDPFWKAQIVQLEMDAKGGITLIPRVGVHQVILGSASGFKSKLANLKEFYDKGITQTNWNLYQSLDLRFKNQVVCLKR